MTKQYRRLCKIEFAGGGGGEEWSFTFSRWIVKYFDCDILNSISMETDDDHARVCINRCNLYA